MLTQRLLCYSGLSVHSVVPTGKELAHHLWQQRRCTRHCRKVIATIPTGAGPNGISFAPLAPSPAPAVAIELDVMKMK